MSAASAIGPILLALLIGYLCGKRMSASLRQGAGKLLGPLVWLLLFSIGLTFGEVLRSLTSAWEAMRIALYVSVSTTLITWALIAASTGVARARSNAKKPTGHRARQDAEPAVSAHSPESTRMSGPAQDEAMAPKPASNRSAATSSTWITPVRECGIALSMVALGVLANTWVVREGASVPPHVTGWLLFLLVGLVGAECAGVKINAAWFGPRVLFVPALVVVGSLIGGALAALLAGLPLPAALALSSGFGWFTLSGVVIGQHWGAHYGTAAFLTDLLRELFAIVLLYFVGKRFSRACIGASAATALDSTLPMIRQNCAPAYWPTAIVSGLILSLLAPLMMSVFVMGSTIVGH